MVSQLTFCGSRAEINGEVIGFFWNGRNRQGRRSCVVFEVVDVRDGAWTTIPIDTAKIRDAVAWVEQEVESRQFGGLIDTYGRKEELESANAA